MTSHPTALTLAGSGSGCGADIQADLKTFAALGVYGTSAITVHNTCGGLAVDTLSPAMVAAQIEAVLDDISLNALKIGMLASVGIVEAVGAALDGYYLGPVVLEPVMVAKAGNALLTRDAEAVLIAVLLRRADLLTPNLPEAARLLGVEPARDASEVEAQGRALLEIGASAVVMKGGQAEGSTCVDRLVTSAGVMEMAQPRLATRNAHGTGCTLSSANAAGLARGPEPESAVRRVQSWLHGANRAADTMGIGGGQGPVAHFHEVRR